MDKNESLHPAVLEAWKRGKVKTDTRQADLAASREHVIQLAIAELQSKLDAYLKPKNAPTGTG